MPPTRTAVAAAVLLSAVSACSSTATPQGDSCTALFGQPAAATGLTAAQCQPSCACAGVSFTPPTYSAAFVADLASGWRLENPFPPLTANPYDSPAPPDDPFDTVCGVLPAATSASPRPYTLVTYASEAAARAAGASVTHFGHCGVCSSLENLAVYMGVNDLTEPVRDCGIRNLGDFEGNVVCLQALGFDLPCAQIWAYNTANTAAACRSICYQLLGQPYHLPDGRLNDCILCDEVQSGAVFKAVAGRTRRNSGLPNALCRPCSEVRPLVH
ncbi:MAG TPA: hypothetical protein PLL32_08855, partial [Anaeromyxobacteraceae bacterium]|nr:hypothetical protein [Anaeromyxobacteraceae bacterium]